ncbi:MAG: glycerate kinase [Aerococcus sp.]|nr:glycerate kinase [Aerococcus sp.]
MRIVLAPDSFKGSLSAKEVCDAMAAGIHSVLPEADVIAIPMADGGDGTVEAMVLATQGKCYTETVQGPLPNQQVEATYGILGDGVTAVIEMAAASGLDLVPERALNPRIATTYGVGELITAALDQGAETIIIGLGGSATNDGGAGMAQALGVKFYDANHKSLKLGGAALSDLETIDVSELDPRLQQARVIMASDVTNPLTGRTGATAVFGPQKGADEESQEVLDAALTRYGEVLRAQVGQDVSNNPGAGAGGGIGAGLMAFLGAEVQPGVDVVIRATHLEQRISAADVVFTGEGRIDDQTQYGKTPQGVAKTAKKYGKPVIVIAGSIDGDVSALYQEGVISIFGTIKQPGDLEDVLRNAKHAIQQTSANVTRLLVK